MKLWTDQIKNLWTGAAALVLLLLLIGVWKAAFTEPAPKPKPPDGKKSAVSASKPVNEVEIEFPVLGKIKGQRSRTVLVNPVNPDFKFEPE